MDRHRSERLAAQLEIEGNSLETIAKIFQVHPCFHPRTYIDLRVAFEDDHLLRIELADCPALAEGDAHSWFATLGNEPHPAIDAIARAINPRARSRALSDPGDARFAWEIEIDDTAPAAPPPQELNLAKISRGAAFQFEQRRLLRA